MPSFINCIVHKYNKTDAPKVVTAQDIYQQLQDIKNADREIFIAFHMNTKMRVIAREIITIGTLNASLVHPRSVFRTAVTNNTYALILAHNHPSGDPTPSPEDKNVYNQLKQAGDILGIKILDMIIAGDKTYHSIQEGC